MSIRRASQFLCLSVLAIIVEVFASFPSMADDEIRFNRDVRPILSQACFRCHGFDQKTREADLRLDVADGALAERGNGRAAVVPNNLSSSLIWERIHSTDASEVMPPPSSNRQLTTAEKDILKRWIEQGAKYEKHWSLEPIPPSPGATDIDLLLDAEIHKRNLQLTPQADPVTLARRAAFTLTGLPPSQQQVDGFAKAPTPENYAALIDQLLKSPHYGEEMAKHWLDVARYGDTHGLHLDNERTMWAYRDWVVQAFNENLPFDQFTVQQLAGDLLPNPTQQQLIATGFNRCNVTTSEGGAINEEFLFRYAVDRTSTTVQTWLGLTGGCAVCHDHKYDPLSTKEFYSLYAFFYSAADPAMDGNIADTKPFLPLTSPNQKAKIEQAKQDEKSAKDKLLEIASHPQQRTPLQSKSNNLSKGTKVTRTSVWIDDLLPLGASTRNTSRNPEVWVASDEAPMGRRYLKQSFGNKYDQSVNGGWPARVIPENGSLKVWVMPDRYEPPQAIFVSIKSGKKSIRWAWANSKESGKLVDTAEDKILGPMPQPGVWTQLIVPLNEFPANSDLQELHFGLFGGICSWDGMACTGTFETKEESLDWKAWWNSQKGKDVPFVKGGIAQAIKEGPESEPGKKHANDVETHFYAFVAESVSEELIAARNRWQNARIALAISEDSVPGTFMYKDTDKPREAFVMKRGQYDQKGDPVEPATPAALPPLKKTSDEQRLTRLDLARWIVAVENPLTARVTVNRFWQQVFGTGLVKSSDDFGTQGIPPTHPELLDALSSEFMKNGWDVKGLMKKLLLTRAFQRSAVGNDQDLKSDPENRFLARGPRIRLDAEQIRDNVLASATLLNRELGGPGFKGYQPPGIWEPVGYGDSNTRYYIQDHGASIYRRSLYAFLKRTAPPPFMTNFDAPNREQFCTRRERSNTPLQALQLMNDVQYVEAARFFAEVIWAEQLPDDLARVRRVFQGAMNRAGTDKEIMRLNDAYQAFRQRFLASESDALRLLAMGEKPRNTAFPASEIAALTLLVNVVFNLDEFVTRN
jgi:hypothetical protein